MKENKVILEAKKICKDFGSVHALKDVDFTLCKGEVHGLIGENGSGKSTLSSIIAGVQGATSGVMVYKGSEYAPDSVIEANEYGVAMLLQERGTFEHVSVASNIFVGKESLFMHRGYLNLREMNSEAKKILDQVGISHIKAETVTGKLGFEDQKMVEIARVMYINPEILIVDETTTALSREGRNILYDLVNKMRSEDKSIIFISHDIDEVMNICDYVSVLRDGIMIKTLPKSEFSVDSIRRLMVGREVNENFYRNDDKASRRDELALSMNSVSYGLLKNISLDIYKGEIVGIGGLTDCGMHDVGRLLFGVVKPDTGEVTLANGIKVKNTEVAVKNRIGYVEKDRDSEALMTASSIRDNICAPSLKKIQRKGFISNKAEKEFAEKWAMELDTKMSSVDQLVMQLSGGNKQKVSVAKWIGYDADILIFDCPTRGIDIGVRAAIYELLMQLKDAGKSIVMISEELMEVIGMSDRIIAIKNGEISGEFSRGEIKTEFELVEYII